MPDIRQILPKVKTANQAPQYEWMENDQTFPAGMWRMRVQGDVVLFERATAVDWATDEDWVLYDKPNEMIRFVKAISTQPGTALTIATGAVTITTSRHTIDTEGAAATDFLDTINGATYAEQLLILSTANDARDVVLRDAADSGGNIYLGGAGKQVHLNVTEDRIFLQMDAAGAYWCIISPSIAGEAAQSTTFVVAASDSLHPDRADYVCSGAADDVEINAALAEINTGGVGGRVILMEGTFTIVDSITIPCNNVTLEGQGRATFIDGDGLATTEHAITATGRTNLTIKNLAIQTQDAGTKTCHCIFLDNGCNDFLIDGVVVVDSDSDGIRIVGTTVTDGRITNCTIEDTDDYGIYVDMDAANYCDRLTIDNCILESTGNTGIIFGTTGAGARYCVISNSKVRAANGEGISCSEFLYSTVDGNVVEASLYHGISLNDSNNTVISNNVCANNDSGAAALYHGIVLSVADKSTVSGNTCYGNGLHGIYLLRSDYNTIVANTCTDNVAGDGIHIIGDGTGNSDYNVVNGNICTANGDDGIEIVGGANANRNSIVNNEVNGNAGTAIVDAGTLTIIRYNEGFVSPTEEMAVFVIAASNSAQPGNADYYCDGTADDVQINAALNALPTQGGRIVLLEGTFTLADPIVVPDDDIVIEGQGRATFIDGDGLATTEHAISLTGRTNCTIKNLAIQTQDGGTKTCHCIFAEDGCNYLLIEGVVIVDSDYDGIHIEGTNTTDIKIVKCVIEDADDHGIFVDMDAANTSSGLLISGNRITGTGDDGVYFGATGAGHTYARITDNLIDSAGDCGIDVCEMTYSVISNNISHTNTDDGISLSSGSNFNNLVGNQCYNNTSYGISLVGGYNAVVANYTTTNTAGSLGDTGTLNRVKNNRGLWAGDEGVATFVIAASDSYRPANADQRCDGTADDVQIQQLLDALPAVGGRVILMEGNYACAANITIPANATLEGQGNATILTFDDPLVSNCLIVNGSYVTVKSMKIVIAAGCGDVGGGGSRPNIVYASSKSYLWLANLWLVGDKTLGSDGSDERQSGILFITVTDSTIAGCHVEGTERYCIQLYSTSNHNTVTGCVCEASAKTGMLVRDSCEGNSITGCVFQDNGEQGLYLHTSSHNTITGNTSQGNSGMGIYLYLCDNNTITGNTVADNDSGGTLKEGISIYCSDQNVVTGNQVNDNGLHGILVFESSYNTISGNICNNQNTGDGINVTGDTTENSDYNLITGNVCTGNGDDGIAIEGAGDANKNIVLGNQLTGNSGTAFVDNGTATQIGHNITA